MKICERHEDFVLDSTLRRRKIKIMRTSAYQEISIRKSSVELNCFVLILRSFIILRIDRNSIFFRKHEKDEAIHPLAPSCVDFACSVINFNTILLQKCPFLARAQVLKMVVGVHLLLFALCFKITADRN